MGVLAAQTGGEEAIVHLGIPEYQTTARDGVHICITTRRSPQLNVKSGLGIVSPKWTSTSPKSAARSVALSLTLLWTTQLSTIPILTAGATTTTQQTGSLVTKKHGSKIFLYIYAFCLIK